MSQVGRYIRKHTLGAAVLMVAVPLAVLLVLQSFWLVRLEWATQVARKEALDSFLEGITGGVERFYRETAAQGLAAGAAMFLEGRFGEIERRWRESPPKGVRMLFVVDYTREEFGSFRTFDAAKGKLATAPASDDMLAVIMATMPYQMARNRGSKFPGGELVVDERDPERRLILNPVIDGAGRPLGAVGMILDGGFLRTTLIRKLIGKSLARFAGWVEPSDVEVFIESTRNAGEERKEEMAPGQVSSRLRWIFSDVEVSLRIHGLSGERWAKAGLAVNAALSLVLVGAVVGGVYFALRAANRAMHLSQLKSEFVSNVSHELRTPLASVRAFADLLRLGSVADPEKVREYGEIIEAETRRLSHLIDNLLDFSRIESGRKTYTFAETDLAALVERTVEAFSRRQPGGEFHFAWIPGGEPLPLLWLDEEAIGQAVSNLLDNAVKYSGEAREIAAGVRREKDSAVVFVKDAGIGIPPGELERIFERFHRVGSVLVHDVKGSGLGLSIVQHVVSAHGGTVSVASAPGSGSTFSIRLPLGHPGQRGGGEG